VCHLAIKVDKQLKSRKSFHTSLSKSPFAHFEIETSRLQVRALGMGDGIASTTPKRLEGKKYFKCHGFGYFQTDWHNSKTFTIEEVDGIPTIEEESTNEEK